MNIYESLKNRQDFLFKFNDNPFDSGVLRPGWAEPSYDKFFTRMVHKAELLEQSTILPMKALQHDLDMLTDEMELESQRNLSTGVSYGFNDIAETAPVNTRKQLQARPLAARTIITDNFIEENIERDGFMDKYVNLLAEKMGPAFERCMVYGDTSATGTVPSGYKVTDGILKQLINIHAADTTNGTLGTGTLTYKDDIATGVFNAIERYVDNDGNLSNATMVLPPQIYSRLLAEISNDRETALGDAVYTDGKIFKILGVELKADYNLRKTMNGFNKQYFKNGEFSTSSTSGAAEVDKLLYGFIGQPNNLVFGMMREFDVKNQWDIDVFGYKVALLCKGDAKVLFNQDTLAVPFTMNNTPSP